MQVTIQIPTALRDYVGGQTELPAEARDVAGALQRLTDTHPRLQRHLFDDRGELRPYVNVFLNETELRALGEGMRTPLAAGDTLLILPSIAGG